MESQQYSELYYMLKFRVFNNSVKNYLQDNDICLKYSSYPSMLCYFIQLFLLT